MISPKLRLAKLKQTVLRSIGSEHLTSEAVPKV